MSLTQLLETKFRGDIRFRGQAYLEADRVSIARVTADDLHAIVRDGVEYQTHLSRLEGELRMFCSCVGEGQSRDPACKHLWATLLAVDAGSYLTGAAKAGQVPPFVSETRYKPLDLSSWDEDDLEGGDVYIPTEASTKTAAAAAPRAPRQQPREWETKLRDLRNQMPASSRTCAAAESREREIFYEIDVPESRKSQQLVIQTSQRQRRSNGQWGKLKPLKVRPGRLEEVDHADDRQILAFLAGGTPERTGWMAQQAEFQTSVYRYRVPFELCTLILPLMTSSKRLRFVDESEKELPPLTYEATDPWQLCLCLEQLEDQSWELHGEVRRGTQKMRIEKCELLLPGGLVIANNQISRLEDFNAFDWVPMLLGEQKLTARPNEEQDLVDWLLDMPTLPQLDLPKSLQLEEVRPVPSPRLVFRSPSKRGWKHERIHANIEFDYEGTLVRGTNVQWAVVQRELGRCLLRDQQREAAYWAQLDELAFRRLVDHRQAAHDVDIAVSELGRAVRALVNHGWQVHADGKEVRQPAAVKFNIRSDIDWFELTADVDFNGQKANFPELLAALSRGDQTIRLDDGSLGILPEEWLEQYGILAGLGTASEDGVKFSTSQLGLVDALLSTQEFVDVDARYLEVKSKLANFDGVEPRAEPKNFHGELRPYQREGLGWLHFLQDYGFGGCLADDMGLGKTVQMLALFQERRQSRERQLPSLVVVPKSLMFNWIQEIVKFAPELTYMEYTGPERTVLRPQIPTTDLILTTYGTLRRDILELKDQEFDYAVLDEAQTIKNASSQAAKASRLLKAHHRVALSGTPIENHLGDLWSIFEFLNPGMLGRSSAFKTFATETTNETSRRTIASGVRPFVLRRTKGQVAKELPEKFEETIYCKMGERQRQLYSEMRDYYRDSLLGMVKKQGMGKSRMHVLEALLRLRQAACHPALLDKGSEDDEYAKLDVLCPQLEELIQEGHKSLVFSQFTSMLSIVKKHLDRRGVTYAYLDGQTRKRKQVVDQFQNDPKTSVFLISLKAGGLGLNLTEAEYVFLLDPWWNPAVEAQAIDRAHRVGQTKRVFAYRLICRDTVEEKILELQKQKRELADAILESEGTPLSDLTTDDLELLLS
ncbi:DEAD/DEAH box helicase [Planctomicrobium piriforme]|uniref:Helicase conserved C-terminal domain-containing protein n=1 Tax=Planctomicrobium piriforme TaxID=1576369 RepID=A0A1I3IBQ5_9PLAN|nr:DEAD/DEAH box helicase [Planctomicrobium piriforme]SFI45434.1 Helicase conserved C-terminal domain-containing protein [Planctomicrobium piriforme]